MFDNFEDFVCFGWKKCELCLSLYKGRSSKCGKCFLKNHRLNDNQKVLCKICDQIQPIKTMASHIKHKHDMKYVDYINNNISDFKEFGWNYCDICKKLAKKPNRKWGTSCSKECANKLRSIRTKGRPGLRHTESTKKKISEANTGKKRSENYINPSTLLEVRTKISKTRIESGCAKGEKNPMFGKTHTPETIRKIFSHKPMNKLEKLVADILDKNNIQYTFGFFINKDGKCKQYDFKIKDRPVIIEVDGDYWHGNPLLKKHSYNVKDTILNDEIKTKLALERGYQVIRLWESDIKKNPDIILESLKL